MCGDIISVISNRVSLILNKITR